MGSDYRLPRQIGSEPARGSDPAADGLGGPRDGEQDRSISTGGAEGPRQARDDRGSIDDGTGRRTDAGRDDPAPHRTFRVDLGCGRARLPEFIGVDRHPLPGVDVIADLDRPLPFADDSVDLVYASHSLEHVHDLPKTIREIYRICKHRAQVCIVAPYSQQGLNLANPYHKQAFNEHTPRFWTASSATPIDPANYYHPHAASWGLLESDNSSADIDLRCVKMEFFYFPEYHDLDDDLRRRHRQHGFDVCDQIVYHLLVLKQPTPDSEFIAMTETMELFESPYVGLRRMRERCDRLEADNRELALHRGRLEAENSELSRSVADLAREAQRSRGEAAELRRDLEDLARAGMALRGAVSGLEVSLSEERRRLASVTGGTGWMALDAIHRAGRVIAPPGTRRGRLAGAIWSLARRGLRRGIRLLAGTSGGAMPAG